MNVKRALKRKSLVALTIYVILVVFSPDFVLGAFADHAIEFRLSDLFFLFLLGCLTYEFFIRGKKLVLPTFFVPALIYVSTFFLGVIVAFLKVGSSTGLQATFFALKYLEYFLIFFVTFNIIRDEFDARLLIKVFLSSISLSAGLLLVTKFVKALNLTLTIGLPSFTVRYHHVGNPRTTLPFAKGFGPSSEFLLLAIPMALFFFFYGSMFSSKSLYFLSLVILGVAFIFTGSRGPMAALAMSSLFVIPFLEKKLIPWLAVAAAGFVGLSFTVPYFGKRLGTFFVILTEGVCANHSLCVRVTRIWPQGLQQFLNHPILGKGLTSFPTSDSQYVRLLADLGVVGTLGFLIMVVGLMVYLFRLRSVTAKSEPPYILASGLIVSLFALLFNGLTATAFEPVRAMEPFWFLVGLVTAYEKFDTYDKINPYMEVRFGIFR